MQIDVQLQNQDTNVTNLKEAPIHLLSRIQSHGMMLVLAEPELNILQVSSNTLDIFGISPENMVQKKLEDILDSFQVEIIKAGLLQLNLDIINPIKLLIKKKNDECTVFDAIFHRNSQGFLILELEPAISQENIPFLSFYHLARASINQLAKTTTLQEFCHIIVQEVQKVTGFDRVILYKFDNDGHGSVLAEEKLTNLETFLGLHYPESDIPKPARNLFISNSIRLIPDTESQSVQIHPVINPISKSPLDLTNSSLRSAAPCHLEYLHNMGVAASLTISLIKDQKLWGLITCHHCSPKYVSYELRNACEFLGRVIFAEISAKEEAENYNYPINLKNIQSQLIEYMSQAENFIDGLIKNQPNLLHLTSAQGAAVCIDGSYKLIGETPQPEELYALVEWLRNNVIEQEVFYTDCLPQIYPDAIRFKNVATGLLAIPISKNNYVLWFRPEVIQTVNWGGNPDQAFTITQVQGNAYLCPRKSFVLWKETVRLTSLSWHFIEIKAALDLRKVIVNIVLRQADELALLAKDLERSNQELKKFAYVASHDLQEPLNQVSNYVQLLGMRYQAKLDADAKDFINYAVEGVTLMQELIDDILEYSKVDRQVITFHSIDVEEALAKALVNLRQRIVESEATITYDPLPEIIANSTLLMQVFQNLIANAIKFRSRQLPQIHIGVQRLEEEWLFSIRDNGIGIDAKFSDRIFLIFQRLHTRDEYSGTGIGLAICKKIIECYRGRIWVESQLGQGSTFYFTIPVGGNDHKNGRKI